MLFRSKRSSDHHCLPHHVRWKNKIKDKKIKGKCHGLNIKWDRRLDLVGFDGKVGEKHDTSCVFWCRSDSSDIRLSIGLLLHFFMFLCVPSHFLHISIPYLCVIFVYFRDIFTHFSYSFICPPPFIPSLPVTFLGLPLHYLAFLLPGFSQSV